MPPTDLEANGLFNYLDWYNEPARFGYQLVVVNPDPIVEQNYSFLRRKATFHAMTLEKWLESLDSA